MPSYLTAISSSLQQPAMQTGGGSFNESPAPDASVPIPSQPVASLTSPVANTGITGGAGATAGPQNGDYQGWFNQLVAGKPFNQQTLLDLEPTLNQNGFQLTPPNAQGDRTKIRLPNGDWVRVGFGEGHPVWINGGPVPGEGGAQGAGNVGGMGYGSLLTPFTDQFHAPSAADVEQTPGYQFQLQQGLKGVQQSAAAKGTLLTGGTMKGLEQYGQNLAGQAYGNAYDRAFNEYAMKYGIFTGNQDRPYTKLLGTSQLGENAAAATGQFGSSYANQGSAALGSAGNASSAGSIAQGNVWGNFLGGLGSLFQPKTTTSTTPTTQPWMPVPTR